MSHYLKHVFLISLLCLLGAYVWLLYSQSHPSWQKWQVKYYETQTQVLQDRLAKTADDNEKASLEKTLIQVKGKKPEIKPLLLPNGKEELCLTCHLGIEEISPSHPMESMGCTVCHGGNALALDEKTAHQGMYGGGHPGRLNVTSVSCGSNANGQCHAGRKRPEDNMVERMQTSLMASKGGELSMVRYMFGLDKVPRLIVGPNKTAETLAHPFDNRQEEPALQQNCLEACHQSEGSLVMPSAPALTSTVATATVEAQGCESCHVLVNATHTYSGQDVTIPRDKAGYGMVHRITTQIPYTQCNQCHNVGLPDLYHMTFNLRTDLNRVRSTPPEQRDQQEVRLQNVYQPGMVFTSCEVNLDCIDCHTPEEVMGDGKLYTSEYQALKIQCRDCHGTQTEPPKTWTVASPDDMALRQKSVNPAFPVLDVGGKILRTLRGEEMPYVRYDSGLWVLYRKTNGQKYAIPQVQGSACRQEPDKQTSNDCHQCHDVSGNHHTSP
ncbi:MAG: multiheme c-type cytochrome [Desulfitobacteriaceae bacterium]|nr:multiheme c-type cytochrome [Desulfitobacteriaceae bacterium]MDI6879250.1 multiheme c-type cytochrome [Desulfitobacteriaceae bacterium]MDI6913730.1 multiheme c-type cytochrome [Desulfitobacteriaceae bacterium]